MTTFTDEQRLKLIEALSIKVLENNQIKSWERAHDSPIYKILVLAAAPNEFLEMNKANFE